LLELTSLLSFYQIMIVSFLFQGRCPKYSCISSTPWTYMVVWGISCWQTPHCFQLLVYTL